MVDLKINNTIMYRLEIYTLLYALYTSWNLFRIIAQYQSQPNRKPTPNKPQVCFLCHLRVCYEKLESRPQFQKQTS